MTVSRSNKATVSVLLVVAFFVLSGCGGKPFTSEQPGDMKSGPGLFTGKSGGVIISPKSD
jgi:hypothetical protein